GAAQEEREDDERRRDQRHLPRDAEDLVEGVAAHEPATIGVERARAEEADEGDQRHGDGCPDHGVMLPDDGRQPARRSVRRVDELDLLDWKRRIAELYAEVRAAADPATGRERWRLAREELFRTHPQSPVPPDERADYRGPFLYDYDPRWRLLAEVAPVEPERFELPSSDGATMAFTRFAVARAGDVELELYWLEGYGGGL